MLAQVDVQEHQLSAGLVVRWFAGVIRVLLARPAGEVAGRVVRPVGPTGERYNRDVLQDGLLNGGHVGLLHRRTGRRRVAGEGGIDRRARPTLPVEAGAGGAVRHHLIGVQQVVVLVVGRWIVVVGPRDSELIGAVEDRGVIGRPRFLVDG